MEPERPPEASELRIAFRGYDVAQVNELIERLAGEGGAAASADSPQAATREGITRIADKTKAILMAAHESAEQLKSEAAERVAAIEAETKTHAETVRSEADDYAQNIKGTADESIAELTQEAEERLEHADREVELIQREAHAERVELETAIDELRERRDAIVGQLERLRGDLSAAVGVTLEGTSEWTVAEEEEDLAAAELELDELEEEGEEEFDELEDEVDPEGALDDEREASAEDAEDGSGAGERLSGRKRSE